MAFFNVILEQWEIVSFGKSTITEAVALCKANEKLDFEDTVQCLCAKEKGCSLLITSDKKFVECGISIVDIDAFLAL